VSDTPMCDAACHEDEWGADVVDSEVARPMERLLRRIAAANVIFPSMCANNMEAYNINAELERYRSVPQSGEGAEK